MEILGAEMNIETLMLELMAKDNPRSPEPVRVKIHAVGFDIDIEAVRVVDG